jgi:hypothetical protein
VCASNEANLAPELETIRYMCLNANGGRNIASAVWHEPSMKIVDQRFMFSDIGAVLS